MKKNIIKSNLDDINYNIVNKRYKIIKYCYDYFIEKKCNKNCKKAHSKKDLNIKFLENYAFDNNFFMFHFRTEFCPLIDFKHNKSNCIYAHNNNEFRRSYNHNLKPKICDKIRKNKICKENKKCKFLHNDFEYFYHPLIYKKNKCKQLSCNKNICHNYHDVSGKRKVKINNLEYFVFKPRKLIKKIKINCVKINYSAKLNTVSEN